MACRFKKLGLAAIVLAVIGTSGLGGYALGHHWREDIGIGLERVADSIDRLYDRLLGDAGTSSAMAKSRLLWREEGVAIM